MLSGECRKNGIWQWKVDVNHWQPGAQTGTYLDFSFQIIISMSFPVYLHNCIVMYQDLWINLTLILQLQATVFGLLASLMATVLGWMAEGKMPFHHVALLCSTSVSTAFMASLLQGKNTSCCNFKLMEMDHERLCCPSLGQQWRLGVALPSTPLTFIWSNISQLILQRWGSDQELFKQEVLGSNRH